jgi:hypothetical protein
VTRPSPWRAAPSTREPPYGRSLRLNWTSARLGTRGRGPDRSAPRLGLAGLHQCERSSLFPRPLVAIEGMDLRALGSTANWRRLVREPRPRLAISSPGRLGSPRLIVAEGIGDALRSRKSRERASCGFAPVEDVKYWENLLRGRSCSLMRSLSTFIKMWIAADPEILRKMEAGEFDWVDGQQLGDCPVAVRLFGESLRSIVAW